MKVGNTLLKSTFLSHLQICAVILFTLAKSRKTDEQAYSNGSLCLFVCCYFFLNRLTLFFSRSFPHSFLVTKFYTLKCDFKNCHILTPQVLCEISILFILFKISVLLLMPQQTCLGFFFCVNPNSLLQAIFCVRSERQHDSLLCT